ncbi:hypothetical protein CHS0354_038022 [Potamilus streckersoni]|uniref:Uncharacterized protein n=1 Tax=Potamilus streckersoni TaxID=2493646 RepID=A0AAE0W178_9BIVA|nr:hypothetical protein CHS0354_038022 [Potamilus streckersoni]
MAVSTIENSTLEDMDCDSGSGSITILFHSPAVLPWDSHSRSDDNDSFVTGSLQSTTGSYNTLSMHTASEGLKTPISRDENSFVDDNDCFLTPLESLQSLDLNDSLLHRYDQKKISVCSLENTKDEDTESLASSIKHIKENKINEQKLKDIEQTVKDINLDNAQNSRDHFTVKTSSLQSNFSHIVRSSKSFDKISNANRTSQVEKNERTRTGNFGTPLWAGTRALLVQKDTSSMISGGII